MSDMRARAEQVDSGVAATRPVAPDRMWRWMTVMMAVAFGALALTVLAIPVVGFGSLLFVFLGVCAVMLLAMVRYGHQNRETLDAGWNGSKGSRRERGGR